MGSRAQTYGRGTSRPDSVAQESGARGNSPGDDTLLTGFPGFSRNHKTSMHVPNQFLRVVLPNAPLTVIRLVALVLYLAIERHQNRWAEITLSYGDIIRATGMSPSSIRPAVDQGIALNYLVCHARGSKNSSGHSAEHVVLSLRRDTSGEYIAEQTKFNGFYDGKGYWTAVPIEFFSDVIWRLKRCMIQVVGAILTATEGTPAQGGGRVLSAPLSNSYLKRAGIDASTQCGAIKEAMALNLIVQVPPSSFPIDPTHKRVAEFRLRWRSPRAAEICVRSGDAQTTRSELIETSTPTDQNSFGNGSEFHRERIEIPTRINREEINRKNKQQQGDRSPADVAAARDALIGQGFSELDAHRLSLRYPPDVILRQIEFLPLRRPSKNPLGYLKVAIEQDYPAPRATQRAQEIGNAVSKKRADKAARWAAYAQRALELIKTTRPADYAKFEAKRREDQEYLESAPDDTYRIPMLREFHTEEALLRAFQEFFPDEVMDLPTWTKRFAAQRPSMEKPLNNGMNTACCK